MTYRIEYLCDEWECDTCGWSCADGYKIYKDDLLVIDKSPSAHCYSSLEFPHEAAPFDILKLEGIEVIHDDCY